MSKAKYGKEKINETRLTLSIYGRQPVLEALRSKSEVEKVWIGSGVQGPGIQQIRNLAEKQGVRLQTIPKDQLQKIVGAVVHQGVAAQVVLQLVRNEEALLNFLKEKTTPLLLILDQIQDPHNLGAILRTAEISAVDAVILPLKGSAELNATVAKTSAGALFHIPLYRCEELTETLERLQSMHIKIVASLPRAEISMYEVDLGGGCAILVGNEGAGVRKNVLPWCDVSMYIPQYGRLNSLNASVSTAVILYEALRQRHHQS